MRRSNARKHDPKINGGDADMDSLKLQYRPKAPHRSANLFSHHHRNSKQTAKSNLVLIASGTLTIALLYYIFVFSTSYRNSLKRKYGIVIDGGSTGSRIHVFSYEMRNGLPVFDFGENGLVSMRASPGLSSYAEDPDSAGGTVAELLDFAKKWIPKQHWGETEIQLMATAGMRLLEKEIQARILDSCRRVMRSSGFKFQDKWASVISGSDEGIYAWVVANYALGALGGDPQKTTGIIELGGASAQVTFVSSEPVPREFSHRIKFGNFTYVLYSHSLLHFGQNVAFDVLRESLLTSGQELDTDSLQKGKPVDPCTPKGYTHDTESRKLSPTSLAEKSRYLSTLHPAGNFSLCRTASLMLLQKGNEKCSYKRCRIGSTFIPKLQGKFLATENFFHTSKFFGLSPSTFLAELMVAGQIFCEEDWSILRRKYHALDEEDLLRYCFSSAYIVAMLHDSLGIALDDARIEYANQVKNIPLDWALGAFISQTAANIESETETDDGSNSIANVVDSSTLLALVCISLVLIFTAWYFSKWRKPQLKTIYDLEKVLDISHLRQDKPRVHLQLHGRPRRRQDQTALRQTKPENAELIKSETQIFREREESSFPHCSFRQSKTITRISFLPFSLIQVFVGYCVVRMSDHLVVFMDRLVTPPATSDPAEDSGVSGSSGSAGPSSSSPPVGDKAARAAEEDQNDDPDEESPLIAAAECRICQEEDSVKNLETPCACSGSLKYAHRKCVQHWCNEKGDITCEICHQPYQPGYIAPPPRPQAEETTIDIGGGWQISGTPLDLNDPRFLAIAEAERQLLEAEYDDYNATNASGAAFCRSAALILMALLLLRHALTITDTDDEDASTFFSLFLLRAAGFLLPCYIMAWAISILQRRRQRQEAAALAAAQFAFVVQSGQNRGLQFTIASAAPPPTATQQQEEHV